jgi:hypothetical protein
MPDSLRRVLFFAFYYPPANTSGVQRAVRWAKYLPKYGYQPVVICSSEEGALPDRDDVYYVPNAATEAVAARQSRLAAMAQRIGPYNEQLPWTPHAVAAAEMALASGPVSAVISTAPPPGTHMAAGWFARRHRLPWVADFRDPILGSPGRARKWARPYDILFEKWIFSRASAAVATTDRILGDWQKVHPGCAASLHLIWNGFDSGEGVGPAAIEPRPYKVITHAGVVYQPRQPIWLAESLERLIERGAVDPASVRIRLIGTLQAPELFFGNRAVARLAERGCLFADGKTVPRADAMREVSLSDYLLILDIANLSNQGYAVPAKLYDNVLMGRPILASTLEGSPMANILRRCGVPNTLVHPQDSPGQIDAKVEAFLRLPSEPVRPSEWFYETFDGERQVQALARILDGVIGAAR